MTSQTARHIVQTSGQRKQKLPLADSLNVLAVLPSLVASMPVLNRAHNFVINSVQRGS